MRLRFILAWALLLAGLCCIQQSSAFWQSRDSNYNISANVGGYQGPGDLSISSNTLVSFWSCGRAVSAAYAAAHSDGCIFADAATGTTALCTSIFQTNGYIDLTTPYCAGSTLNLSQFCIAQVSCVITQVYDQKGSNTVTSSTSTAIPATFSALNGYPCFGTAASSTSRLLSSTITQSLPLTLVALAKRTTVSYGNMIGANSGANPELLYTSTANQIHLGAGTNILYSGSSGVDSNFHAYIGVIDLNANADSVIYVDAVNEASGATGSNPFSSVAINLVGTNSSGQSLVGQECEASLWSGGGTTKMSSGDVGTLNTNMHSATSGWNF